MSSFDSFAAIALAPWLKQHLGKSVTYYVGGSTSTPVTAVVVEPPPESGGKPGKGVQMIHVTVSRADVESVSIDKDRITVAGVSYLVKRVLDTQSPGVHLVEAVRESGR